MADPYYVDPSRSDYHDTIDAGWAQPLGDYDAPETGSIFGDIVHAVSSVARTVASPVASVAKAAYGLASQGTHLLQSGLHAITNNPLWDIAKTGISFIPGVGTAVSAGMAGAAALGRGESLANIGLAAARGALPGGAVTQAAFDAAIGLAKGRNVTDAILQAARSQVPGGEVGKAAFDAATAIAKGHALSDVALSAIRAKVPGGALGQAAFNTAIANFRRAHPAAAAPPTYPQLSMPQNMVARALHTSPVLQNAPARQVAESMKTDLYNVQRSIAAIMNRLQGSQLFNAGDVGALDSLEACCAREGIAGLSNMSTGDAGAWFDILGPRTTARVPMSPALLHAILRRVQVPVRKNVLAHGLLPRLYHQTGELDQKGGWILRSGDTGFGLAQKLTGNGNRWREILAVNPGMSTFTAANGSTQIKPWQIGQRITIPNSWLGTAVPVASPPVIPGIGGGPSTTTTTTPVSSVPTPVTTFPPSSAAQTLPMLRQGDGKASGKAAGVMMWQSLLLKLGSTLVGSADGEFGPKTNAATRGYQTRMGLQPDGIVGPLTWGAALRELEGKPAAAPPAPAGPFPAPPVVVVGPAVPSTADVAKNAAIQTALAFFYQHHAGDAPIAQSPVFGGADSDNDGVWDPRTQVAMRGFQQWNNQQPGRSHLPEDGQPDQASVTALLQQNTADLGRLGEAVPPITPVVGPIPGSGIPAGGPTPNRPPAPPAPPGQAPVTRADTGGDSGIAVVIALAVLAALASQKGSRGKAA